MNWSFRSTAEGYMKYSKGDLHPEVILMHPDMFDDFIHTDQVQGISKFWGAEVRPSDKVADNEIRFVNATEPTDERLNGSVFL